MKLSNLAYGAAGYVLGTRAGRERYETIVRLARRFAGSQTVQSAAGVAQAKVDRMTQQARHAFAVKISGGHAAQQQTHPSGVNGYPV